VLHKLFIVLATLMSTYIPRAESRPASGCRVDLPPPGSNGRQELLVEPGRVLPIVFHIVRDDTGGAGLVRVGQSAVQFLDSLTVEFGAYFRENGGVGINFRVADVLDGTRVEYLRSAQYLNPVDEVVHELWSYSIYGYINIFLVESILVDQQDLAGLSSVPGGLSQGIVVINDRVVQREFGQRLLAHEIGHFLSLYHTHEVKLGAELVSRDRANCEHRGDKICDTPADPGLSVYNMAGCEYVGNERDEVGAAYSPDPTNLMAGRLFCGTHFTAGQLARMLGTIENGYVGRRFKPAGDEISVVSYPNPWASDPSIRIEPTLDAGLYHVEVDVFTVGGRRVRRLFSGLADGLDRFEWDGRDASGSRVSNGVYLLRLIATKEGYSAIGSNKIVILR
jgi:hypothetical protein